MSRVLGLEPLEPRKMWAVVNIGVSAAEIQESPGIGSNNVVVEATTDEPVSGQQTVDVAVSGDGITPGDFALTNVTIVIPDGASSGTATLTSVNDADLEIRETAMLSLTNLSPGLQPGATLSQDVDIRDSLTPDLEVADMRAYRDALAPVVNWVGDEPCTWDGITCAANSVVSFTVVGQNDQLLSIPSPTNLTNLISFQVRKIDLIGSSPNIDQLPNLRVFRIDDNQLSGTLSDVSTSIIDNNPGLVFFNASTNALTGPIPADLLSGGGALQLDFTHNHLSGTFPTEPLGAQRRANYSGNMLEGALPDWVVPDDAVYVLHYNMFDVVNTPPTGGDETWRNTQTVPPTNVQVSSPSAGTAELTWTPILYQGDGGHYEVLSSTTPGGPYTSRGTTAASGAKTATGLTVTGLPGGTNHFLVRTITPNHEFNPNDLTSINSEEVAANVGLMTVSLSAPDAVAGEVGDPGTFRLTRDNPSDELAINLSRNVASTAADTDFELTVGANPPINISGGNFSVTFPDGQDTLDITLTALVDANDEAEADETITLDLATGDYIIDGSADTAAVTIAQNGFLVTTDTDGGAGSLRQAVLNANATAGADTITFGDGSSGGGTNFLDATPDTILLNSELTITEDLTVTGNGASTTLLDGQDSTRLLSIPGSAGDVTLQGLTFTRGQAPTNDAGGAILNSANLQINDSVFTANAAFLGAAINTSGSLTINRSSFLANQAGFNGGAIRVFGSATINESTFAGNTADNGGGAIINHGSLHLANATFSDNQAATGGAIENFGAGVTATVTNTTIHRNTATSAGGGIRNVDGTTTVNNTVIIGNSSPADPDVNGSFTSNAANIIGDVGSSSGFGSDITAVAASAVIDVNLADNGGPTLTHALMSGSPAIDAGISGAGIPIADQRGVPRPQFGGVDIGAVERTIVTLDGALWYLGPDAVGNDLRIFRQSVGEDPVWVGGDRAVRIGLAVDGTVVVQNDSGAVYARPGSAGGIGTVWEQLAAVTAGDGASWFLGPDGPNGLDRFIYRWGDDGQPMYSGGAGVTLLEPTGGTVVTRTSAGDAYRRIGSDTGFGTVWQLLSEAPVAVNLSVSSTEIQENRVNGINSVSVTATTDAPVFGDQTVVVAVSGTEVTPGDFSLSHVTIEILDGRTSGMVTLTSQNDTELEIRETATLSLTNLSAGLQPGATLSQDVDIRDSLTPDLEVADMQAYRDALAPVVIWLGDEPCTWDGIVCSQNKIAAITVVGQSDGLLSIPPPTNLTNLVSFQLREIELTGALPNIDHLPVLRVLDLSQNQLSGPLSHLTDDLAGRSIDSLKASDNALTGSIPAHFFTNAAIDVEVARNRLTAFPSQSLGQHRSNYSGNMIAGVLPNHLGAPSATFSVDYNMLDVVNTPPTGGDESWRNTQTVPPTNVQVSSPSAGTAELTWTPILYQGDGGHYEVLSSTRPGGPYTSRGTTAASGAKTATGLTVAGLPAGTNHFVVRTFTPNHEFNPNDLTSVNSEEVAADLGPLTVSLSAPDAVAGEVGDTGTFRLTRDNPSDELTINLSRNVSSTAADTDFELTVGANPPINISGGNFSVTFPDGQDTLDITLTALVDANDEAEADETITLDLAIGDYIIDGSADTAAVTIAQNGFLVTTDADGGTGSLRQAVLNANATAGADTITFGDGSSGGGTDFLDAAPDTILLNSQLAITEDLTVTGNGASSTILDGQDSTRLFSIPGSAGDVTLQGLTFTRGQAPTNDAGGAILNSANLQINDSVFTANAAFLGAAINTSGSLTINRSSFLANQAGFNGGAIRVFGSATINESTFAGNTADNGGGAIINHGSLFLANDTFSDNQAATGGAIENFGAGTTATITNSTIHQNSATSAGGGMFNNGGTATLQNTIVAGSPSGGDLTSTASGSITGTNNLVADGNVPSGLSNTLTGDPLLGPLQNNGGPTATHALLPSSPAINAGTATGAPATDQRSLPRDAVPDIGAFEVHSTALVGAANTVTVSGNQITIDIFVENLGTETTDNLTLVNNLDSTFGAANYVLASAPILVSGSGTLAPNAAYDGSGTTDLLTTDSVLQSDATAQIRIVVTLTTITNQGRGFGVYSNQAVVTSTDPSGVASVDRSDSGTDPDPNGNRVPSEAGEDDATEFTATDMTPPTVDIVDVTPDPRTAPAGIVTVQFSEDVTGVDISDFTLTHNGQPVDISGLTVIEVTASQYTIDLASVTTNGGTYELKLSHVGSDIQDAAGIALSTDATDQFTLDTVAPQVEQIEINGGDAQRSMVSEITVRFSELVSVDASSFSVQNTTTNTAFVPTVSSQVVNGKTVTTLTFTGPGIIGGSLPDGNYDLTVIDTQVTDTVGNILDGDGDGQAGVSATDDFFRLFGDADGDRDVDRRDFLFLLRTYNRGIGDARFNSALDYDGDGDVDFQDFLSFRSNYRRTLGP